MYLGPFYQKTLLDDKAKTQKLISAEMREMCAFQLEMHETADFHSIILGIGE